MMIVYEFSTQVADSEAVVIPHEYARKLHKGTPMRVILLVEETVNGSASTPEILNDVPSLEEIVARIQRMGPNPNNITPASGLLAQHLRELPDTPDPDFDVEEWMKEWDRFEAETKAASLAHEETERLEWAR